MHELPLVFFTVFAQASVGLFLFITVSRQLKTENVNVRYGYGAVFILMLIALTISTFHVGHPFRGFNALLGFGRSMMSNEIVLSGLFLAGSTICLWLSSRKNCSALLLTICAWLTLSLGLAFVWSMGQVYQIATVATWDSTHTSLQMWLTLVIVGGALAMLFGVQKVGLSALLLGVIAHIALRADYIYLVSQRAPALAAEQINFWSSQSTLAVAAAILAVWSLAENKQRTWLITAAIAVMSGEIAGRIAFYNLWVIPM